MESNHLVVEVRCMWACWGMILSVQLSTSDIMTTSKMTVLTTLIQQEWGAPYVLCAVISQHALAWYEYGCCN